MLHALRTYRIEYTAIDFPAVIREVLKLNGLEREFARVSIFYPLDGNDAHPVVQAVPFKRKPYKAYRLCLCEERHVSDLNAQKTTSSMFFHLALKQARAKGFDDAALTDFDNTLLESTTGAIVLMRSGDFHMMESPYRLPSTSLELAEKVIEILPRRVNVDDLCQYRHAYLLNSMIGMRPIVSIGETGFVPDEETCRDVTAFVLDEPI